MSSRDKKPSLRPWTTEECEELVRFFFEKREILIEVLLKHKIAKDLNDIVSKLFAEDDFEPSADQVKRKFQDILNKKTKETKAEANMSQEVKGMLDQIRKEIKEATSSADGDGRESPSLASGGSAPSPTPNIAPASQSISGESNSSSQDVPNQAENQGRLDELIELVKTLDLRVKNLENDPKKKE